MKEKHQGPKNTTDPFWNSDPISPDDFLALGNKFFTYLKIRQYSCQTIRSYRIHLKLFVQWCHQREIFTPTGLSQTIIEHYQRYLAWMKHPKSKKTFSPGHRKNRIAVISLFCQWLVKNNYLIYDPTESLDPLKVPKRLPHNTFTHEEVEKVMLQPNLSTPSGLRDRAILETIYSTGLSRSEITRLQISDIDFSRGTLLVREGKDKKDRMIPIGKRAMHWIERYLEQARPLLATGPEIKILFINKFGELIHYFTISNRITGYIKAANLGKQGSSYTLRHTMVMLMLDNGADIRHIQEILGHTRLSTTQVYTKVSIAKLKEIHNRTHPARMTSTETQEIVRELDKGSKT